MAERYQIGNAQTIGNYEIQSNYFATWNEDAVFAVLADGTIDHMNGRRAAILAVETSRKEFRALENKQQMSGFFDLLSVKIMKSLNDNIYLDKKPNLSLTIIYLEENSLNYYSVGLNQLFLYDGSDFIILKDRNGHSEIGYGCTIGITSQNVCRGFREVEFLKLFTENCHPYYKAQKVIKQINEKNIKNIGNSTILLIET